MDLVCFSHLRWNFVYQRPQHLLSRFAKVSRVFYIEEPEFHAQQDHYDLSVSKEHVNILVLKLEGDQSRQDIYDRQKALIDEVFRRENIIHYISWYYTPMALRISDHLIPQLTVYDCMDELSAFKFAPPLLKELEQELLSKADIVFTGGHSLYQAKRDLHSNIHPFPSSIDKAHFGKARDEAPEPEDQNSIPHPRFGYYGVIDERFDIELIRSVAEKRPDWHFVLVGPVVKIDPATLPESPNIHFLGGRSYDLLPDYLRGWDIAIIPFLLNESTRYISPTKTPEYLAGGKPVISTSIRDVINPYGERGLVRIAETPEQFILHAEQELSVKDKTEWLSQVDEFLENDSWDTTWQKMVDLIHKQLLQNAF